MVLQNSSGVRKLEVIVTSAAEALSAEQGGADRLEIVRELKSGGLTPSLTVVREILAKVSIPVRVMLRENASMLLSDADERKVLQTSAREFSRCAIDGLVLGWVSNDGEVDADSLQQVLSCAPNHRVTFHRAFEHLADPYEGLRQLKKFPQIDRILTSGGKGSWPERRRRLQSWRDAAAPEIQLLVGGDLTDGMVSDLMTDPGFPEIHVGRVVRTPAQYDGAVDPERVSVLKRRWNE